jgi:hypothetical protein
VSGKASSTACDAPVASTTGAIRLEDQKPAPSGCRLANKSMLMNQKLKASAWPTNA